MALLHSYLTSDIDRFRSLLQQEQETQHSRNGKAKISSGFSANGVDRLGRTMLHLAASDGKAEFVTALLEMRALELEKCDAESGWSALHRALYSGNISIARQLVECKAIRGASRKDFLANTDFEKNTAFDLYNSTVLGVNPRSYEVHRGGSDLFSFGSNANHTLGFSDADDRAFPERVALKRFESAESNAELYKGQRIRDVIMSKYHTILVTTDPSGNLFSCGFAKNGRLGLSGGTHFTPQPVSVPGEVVAAAAGQDHSLAVLKNGDIYSWGSNTSGQLGYELEDEQSFAVLPRKIIKLAKEKVVGVAASVSHSVCFTGNALYTWGYNSGALGYDANTHEGKIVEYPRKVTSLLTPVRQAAATRFATVCLLDSDDVIVFTNYGYFKLVLPSDRFALQYQVFRPKQAYAPSKITKVTAGTATIAVMTNMGDVYSFSLDSSTADHKPSALAKLIKPSRIWVLRKRHMAGRDVAIGQEDSLILCTAGGSVYTGIRKGYKRNNESVKVDFKFSRVFGITRAIQVRANANGAFGIIRDDVQLNPIRLTATNLAEDLLCTLPYSSMILEEEENVPQTPDAPVNPEEESASEDDEVAKHITNASSMLRDPHFTTSWECELDTFDVSLIVQGQSFPAHKIICGARCPFLSTLFSDTSELHGFKVVKVDGITTSIVCEDRTWSMQGLMIVMHWMYTDILLLPWIGCRAQDQKRLLAIKEQSHAIATALHLKPLAKALSASFRTQVRPSLATDISKLLHEPVESSTADLRLLLEDGHLLAHSPILAARSEFFQAMIAGSWIHARRTTSNEAFVDINVKHITVKVMKLVLAHIYNDRDSAVFDEILASDVDDYLDVILSVMSASAELLLPRLKEACQATLSKHVHRKNVAILLHEADRYSADELKEGCLDYCARNLQFLMEKDLLANLSPPLMHDLELYIGRKQHERLPVSKSGLLLSQLVQRNPDVLDLCDNYERKYLSWLLLQKPLTDSTTESVGSAPIKQDSQKSRSSESPSALNTSRAVHSSSETRAQVSPVQSISNTESAEQVSSKLAANAKPLEVAAAFFQKAQVNSAQATINTWRQSNTTTTPIDLRSALSEALSGSKVSGKAPDSSWSPVSTTKANQKDRKRNLSSPKTPSATPLASSSSSPWAAKKDVPVTPLFSISRDQQVVARSNSVEKSPLSHLANSSGTKVSSPQPIRRSSGTAKPSSLHAGSSSYSKSYHAASPASGPSAANMSLGEIIAAEKAAKHKMEEYNAKRSMKEIQEQEAFEQWFKEESLRVQEQVKASEAKATNSSKKEQAANGNKKPSGRSRAKAAKKAEIRDSTIKETPGKSVVAQETTQKTTFHPTAAEFKPSTPRAFDA